MYRDFGVNPVNLTKPFFGILRAWPLAKLWYRIHGLSLTGHPDDDVWYSASARSRRLCPASFDALANRRSAGPSKSSRNATALPIANLRISSPH